MKITAMSCEEDGVYLEYDCDCGAHGTTSVCDYDDKVQCAGCERWFMLALQPTTEGE